MSEGVGSRRRLLAVGAVTALLVLSGCALFTGGGGDPATPTPTPTNASLDTVRADALAAMAAVDSYRVNGTVERRVGRPRDAGEADPRNLVNPRVIVTDTTVAVNRSAAELRAEDVQRADGQTVSVTTYVVNGTLYANSPAFRGREFPDDYGSEWVVRDDLSAEEFAARFDALDPISRQRELLSAANLTLDGVDPDGETYVLTGTVPAAEYRRYLGNVTGSFADATSYEVTDVEMTYHVDRETGRPLRFEGEVGLAVTTDRGVVPVSQTVTLTYDGYGEPVEVSLPNDAPAGASLVTPS
jgi:hypothetical protein